MTDTDLIPAATVLLMRDTVEGPEVLMVRRNSKIAFGGLWAFPGGRVDDHEIDPEDSLESARRAAVREVAEETEFVIDQAALRTWSFWAPPPGASMVSLRGPRRRFATWFFVAPAPAGDVVVDGGEIHDHAWHRPEDAVARHLAGEMELVPPTWVTLHQLSGFASLESLMDAAPADPPRFETRPIAKDPAILAWAGDAGYESGDPDAPGGRNRLTLHPDNRWVHEQG